MNRIVFLFIIILFTSCNYFEKKKLNSEDLLQEDLKTFSWNDVDLYPRFSICDGIIDKLESKECFQNTLLLSVNSYLESQNIIVSNDVNDTIRLKITIDNKGNLVVNSITIKPETVAEIPEIDSLMRQSIKELPNLQPATKRGQEVTTSFELPIVVRIH